MNVLQELIATLNTEEARTVNIFLRRTNDSGERKDVELFDNIRKSGEKYDEEKIALKLYSEKEKNTFYRLKNRLVNDINRSLSLLYYNQNDYSEIIHKLVLAKLFLSRGQHDLAYRYLSKIKQKADKNEYYDLLDLIYNELIKLSHEMLSINPVEFIEKRKENDKKLKQIREIEDVLAVLIYQIKTSQNFGKKDKEITDFLQKKIDKYVEDKSIANSAQLRFKIYHAISRILLQQADYKSLEKYLSKTYTEFTKEGLFNKNNHETKLQMLTYLANSLFKIEDIKQSLIYTELLHDAMKEFNAALYDKYLFYYYNALVINYSVVDKRKAVSILLKAKEEKAIQKLPVFTVFIYLNLAVQYFDLKEFKNARKNISSLKQHKSFKELNQAFQLKISIVEILIWFEEKDDEYTEHLIHQVRREYKKLLSEEEFEKEEELISIVQKWTKNDFELNDSLVSESKEYIKTYSSDKENDVVDYSEWLKGKLAD
jgi:hypothetical protein